MKFSSPALLILLVLLIAVSLFLTLRLVLFNSAGFDSGTVLIPELRQEMNLSRTESGMVIIILNHPGDFETALGFTHARDRLWQLEKMHRAVNSTQSLHFGEGFRRADLLTRILLDTGDLSMQQFFGFSDEQMESFARYASGINAFITQAGRQTSIQFTINRAVPSTWTADDVAAAFVLQSWLLETGWQQDLANFMVSKLLPPGLPPVLFGIDAFHAFSAFEPNPPFLEQISELLIADFQLRELLNAPKQIEAVRAITEWNDDGSANSLLTFQSGPNTPGFWYDLELSGRALPNGRLRSFTLPGTPVLWAGADSRHSWHPVQTLDFSKLLLPSAESVSATRLSIQNLRGGSMLFRLHLTPSSFTLLPDQRSPYAFRRKNTEAGETAKSFPNPANQFTATQQAENQQHIAVIPLRRSEQAEAAQTMQVTGFRATIAEALKERSVFGDDRLLGFENPEMLVTHKGRFQFAQNLSEISAEYRAVPSLAMAAEYLSNWDGQYNRYLTAATLTELSLYKTADNALSSYLEPEIVEVLRMLNLTDPEIGVSLLEAHIAARGRTASPVSDQFFARRIQEALFELETIFGPEPYEWRWGNVNKNTFSDAALCGRSAETSFIRTRACFTLEAVRNVSVLGQRDLVNAAVVSLRDGSIQTKTFTTGLLKTRLSPEGTAAHVSLLAPGYSENPFSLWFDSGMSSWPFFERFTTIPNQSVRSTLTLSPGRP